MKKKSQGKVIVRKNREPKLEDVEVDHDRPSKTALRLKRLAESQRKYSSVSDILADHKYHYRNYEPDGLQKLLKKEKQNYGSEYCYVNKMYPYAKGGELFIDEPESEEELIVCEKKLELLNKLGVRYLVIKPRTTLEENLLQLEEIDSDLDGPKRRLA